MSLSFGRWSRTITIAGFVSDADPNVTPPNEAQVFKPDHYLHNGAPTSGHMLAAAFNVETETAVVTFTTWLRDANDNKWYKLSPDTIAHREAKTANTRNADVFFRVTAIGAPTAGSTTVTLKACEN